MPSILRRFGAFTAPFAILVAPQLVGQESPPLLLQQPTISKDAIVFVFAGDLWRVPRTGGAAIRLTSNPGAEHSPQFSPDGSQIAFSAEYDGNVDVFVIPANGGVPKRLTSHPTPDTVVGWTVDGSCVVFRSPRNNTNDGNRLFTVPLGGGMPLEIPLPIAEDGSFSPDGARLAYSPLFQWQPWWKRYRGGQTAKIWIANLSDSSIEELPRDNSNDSSPMWSGDSIYFLSDRNGAVTLFRYDLRSKKVTQQLENKSFDFKSASLGPDAIVIEQFGSLHVFDLKSGRASKVNVRVEGDFPEVRRRLVDVEGKNIGKGRLSATGQRAVFETRGEIISVPSEHGDVRNLSRSTGVADRDPAWSPDGKWIAYFSDESGEYALYLADQTGLGEKRVITLSEPSFFYSPTWSPDSKRIAYTDKHLRLWTVSIDPEETPVLVDTAIIDGFEGFAWSPDSKWLAYSKPLSNRLDAVNLYNLADKSVTQVTDGMSDAAYPTFDAGGKFLYFAASTDVGPAQGTGDLSGMNRPVTRSIYLAVLDKTLPSPLVPKSDDEKGQDAEKEKNSGSDDEKKDDSDKQNNAAEKGDSGKDSSKEKKVVVVKIDLDGISQRIVALPMPAKNYKGLHPGKNNTLWFLEGAPIEHPAVSSGPGTTTLHKFDLEKRESKEITGNLRDFSISADGGKILYKTDDNWFIVAADDAPKKDAKPLKFGGLRLEVDPRTEWRQMFNEVWRIQRDFFYDPNLHGLNRERMMARYEPFLDGIKSRADLTYLFQEMLGELSAGHVYVGGGDRPDVKKVPTGMLGADYRADGGRYAFARIYDGENWNPDLRAPLTEPGIDVKVGEFLLAVDNREVTTKDSLYTFFEGTVDREVTLKIGPSADSKDAREVKVRPIASESKLRNRAWIEDNRRKVAELSGGRLGYIYVPDTAGEGFTSFNRYFFAQVDKQGLIIDERFNHGGWLADHIIDYLRRPIMSYAHERDGVDISSPLGAGSGPKVMLINETAGSGGDYLPWTFRKAGLGPLVGKRTWGGLIGIGGYPSLIDGGFVTAPRWAIYGLHGEWEVENHGIAPDVEVEFDPKAWREGHDTQLEAAVGIALKELEKNPPKPVSHPPFPNYHQ